MSKSVTAPSESFYAITPSDTVNYSEGVAKGIYVGVTGNVSAIKRNGDTVLFVNAQQGSILPIFTIRVNATNTTATDLIALY